MRAYRSPAETRLSGVFSAATTRMQSAGQAAAHNEQPTHFSRPFSCRHKRWRPRKRGYTGRLYSGYCCVIGFLKICLKVTPKPLNVSSGCGLISKDRDQERGDDGVQRRDGQQHLPAEAHQLVVAEARPRCAHPHEEEDDREQLEDEPDGSDLVAPRAVPPGEEERQEQRAE